MMDAVGLSAGRPLRLRRAVYADVAMLRPLIDESVRALHRDDYPEHVRELALEHVYGVDTALIDDGTYFVVEDEAAIVACGGWSKRAKLCGADHFSAGGDAQLASSTDVAKIRAFYVLPSHVRRGLASLLLATCEREAVAAGFRRAEMGATLTGVPFYAARGYRETGRTGVPLPDGSALTVVRMERDLGSPEP